MARYQNGSVRIEQRKNGPTWVYRFQTTRADGKRVEHTMPLGSVGQIGDKEKDAWDEVDRQHLRETINQFELPFHGKPRTYGQLCQHYMGNELMEDQSEATIEKAFATIETYKRHLVQRIIPRWGRLAPLAIESLEVEKWFRELKKGDPKRNMLPLADPTIDKIRRVMHLVYLHGQRCNFLPRQQEGNPMNWVR